MLFFFRQKTQSVIIRHDGRVIKGTVIYTTIKNVPYDIAVIAVTGQNVNIIPCQISDRIPSVGEVKNTNYLVIIIV